MSQSDFLRNVANSLESRQRFTVPATCTMNSEQLPSMQPLRSPGFRNCNSTQHWVQTTPQGEAQLHIQTPKTLSAILGSESFRV